MSPLPTGLHRITSGKHRLYRGELERRQHGTNMSSAEDKLDRNEARFESAPWHCHSAVFGGSVLMGDDDKDFADSFSIKGKSGKKEARRLWTKIQTVHEDSRSGYDSASEVCYRFLALDLVDGSLFYQEAADFSDISQQVQEYNAGLEFEEETLLRHLEDVVGGKHPETEWRYSMKVVREKNQLLPSAVLGYISFRAKLERINFDFKFDCRRVGGNRNALGKDFGFVHLSSPLYMVAQFAMAQREELLKIISKKDKEIEDYKLQNAKTSRPHLTTPVFDAEEFERNQLTDFKTTGMNECGRLPAVMDVYQKLMQQYLAASLEERHSRKRGRISHITHEASQDSQPKKTETQEPSRDDDDDHESPNEKEEELPKPNPKRATKTDKNNKSPVKEEKPAETDEHKKDAHHPKKKRGLF